MPDIQPFGDSAVLVSYDVDGFCTRTVKTLHALAQHLRETHNWEDIVPAYDSLLVRFNPAHEPQADVMAKVKTSITQMSPKNQSGRLVEFPVCYGGDFGPDMAQIQKSSGLSEPEIVALHSGQDYLVCVMGFIPGFTFLSEAPAPLHHPRHATPRLKVPAGSVGIAGWQTGLYGLESPGGWQLIGRTPLSIFDPNRDTPFLIEAGDTVRFIPETAAIFS